MERKGIAVLQIWAVEPVSFSWKTNTRTGGIGTRAAPPATNAKERKTESFRERLPPCPGATAALSRTDSKQDSANFSDQQQCFRTVLDKGENGKILANSAVTPSQIKSKPEKMNGISGVLSNEGETEEQQQCSNPVLGKGQNGKALANLTAVRFQIPEQDKRELSKATHAPRPHLPSQPPTSIDEITSPRTESDDDDFGSDMSSLDVSTDDEDLRQLFEETEMLANQVRNGNRNAR